MKRIVTLIILSISTYAQSNLSPEFKEFVKVDSPTVAELIEPQMMGEAVGHESLPSASSPSARCCSEDQKPRSRSAVWLSVSGETPVL